MARDIRFTVKPPGGDRVHHISPDDVRVVLSRLPTKTYNRVKAIHFNDQSWGGRSLGYSNRGRREISMCSLPPRMSLTRFLVKGQSPEMFGAKRGTQWPELAIRRFLLYDVLLHEIGHLLLASTGHSRRGLMRAVFRPKDWDRAGMGDLLFTPGQGQRVRAGVMERLRQQEQAVQMAQLVPAN